MRTVTLSLALFIAAITSAAAQSVLAVSSPAFTANGNIPAKYTCQGANVNPPLTVWNIPKNAKTLAITIHDPDAAKPGGVTHWVVWNIPTSDTITENFTAGSQGLNTAGKSGYMGMCPPTGSHHYHFMVYALNSELTLAPNSDQAALENAIKGHILAQGELVGLYTKQ